MKSQLLKERDDEIDKIIHQLSEDVAFSSNETSYKKKLNDLEARYESEIKELKKHLSLNFEKLNQTNKEHQLLQTEYIRMKNQVEEKDMCLVEKDQLLKQYTVQLNSMKVRENVLADEIS